MMVEIWHCCKGYGVGKLLVWIVKKVGLKEKNGTIKKLYAYNKNYGGCNVENPELWN